MQVLSNSNFQSYLHQFDVRSKLFVSISCALTALFLSSLYSLCFLACCTLIYALLMNRVKVLMVSYLFMFLMMFISLSCVKGLILLYPSLDAQSMSSDKVVIPILRGIAAMNAVIPLALTIKIHKLLTALQSFHLPFVIYLPCAIMVRFIPAFINDIKQVFESLKIKGFKLSIKNIVLHPRLFLRLTFVPLVFLTLRTSDDLAIASELKGIGLRQNTCYKQNKFFCKDYTLICVFALLCILSLYLEKVTGGNFYFGVHA